MSLASRLYAGESSYDFIGRRKLWYAISAGFMLISLASLLVRGFNLGIDFQGGGVFEFSPKTATTVTEVRETVKAAGVEGEPVVEKIGSGVGAYRVKTESLTSGEVTAVANKLSTKYGVPADSINPTSVSPTWGKQITNKALIGLAVFLALVIVYISMRFEPKMAAAAILALLHDILITAGIYSIVGFEVTPSTVIAFLTILGYSLYDTVVVFDKVRENTQGLAGGNRMDYSTAANLSVNQTLMRSINTSLTSLLPVASLLFVGVFLLGAGSLKDLSLALFVGIATGAYSSIFVATPLLADFKEREPQFKALKARVAARQAGTATRGGRLAAAGAGGGTVAVSTPATTVTDEVPETPRGGAAKQRSSGGGSGRPQPRPQKKKGGKGGRPSGKKRR
ncbi:MAG TPA: protein translocase subunit SecF [Mycobacteriales bacterium]|jgi:preprotein translocase subunit SecF|nr:protein translocase subunit SecF [Mycobacteriales bacterium]